MRPIFEEPVIDVITVFHNQRNFEQHQELEARLDELEDVVPYRFIGIDNREENRGFAGGCNYGAYLGGAPYLAFINPDARPTGSVLTPVMAQFNADPELVITGSRFAKPDHELQIWGCQDWVCGAAFFVRRDWFESVGGFDDGFVWGWEETDLIRRAQAMGVGVRSIPLPIEHSSPSEETPEDAAYKQFHFDRGARRFGQRWGMARV